MSSAASGGGTKSGDVVGVVFKEAVDGENFGWLKANSERWKERRDLLDYMIAKGADVTVWFIQSVGALAKRRVLAALFDKGEAMIDDVLGGIEYSDGNLCLLTDYRPELAASHEKFFRVLDKIEDPEWQEMAVREGVKNLFEAGRHDLVVPLVNALGKKTFKSKRLKDVAIQVAFYGGTIKGNQYFVELYCEHPAITSEIYAHGLCQAWNGGEPNQVFPFLLEQADQGDLDMVKEKLVDEYYEKFRQAIDKTPETAPPAGSRHLRPIERNCFGSACLDHRSTCWR